ncbi:MAG: recombination mediator RecR [Acidobacteriota bacterium]
MFEEHPSSALEALLVELKRLPGIGAKSAQRLASHLMRVPKEDARRLARAIDEALALIHPCSVCHNLTDRDPCALCADPARTSHEVCVVEDSWSVRRVEQSGAFRGRYHVLGGTLSPLKGVGPDELAIASLCARLQAGEIAEVILATSPTSEGEATAALVASELRATAQAAGVTVHVSRIAYGMPVGSDLETVDEVTLGKALDGRREMR